MKNKIIFFAVGLLSGILLFSFNNMKKSSEQYRYIVLKEDYTIEGVGTLKKGTKVRIDQEMEEGFTRCILYLNHKYGETELVDNDKDNLVIPYWLTPKAKE